MSPFSKFQLNASFRERILGIKKVTILFVPDGSTGVRRFRVPRFILNTAVLLCILSAAVLYWVLEDYRAMKAEMPRLAQLERENAQHRKQTVFLAQRINKITERMCELNELDRKLKIMVNLEPPEGEEKHDGVGGPDPLLLDPKSALEKTHRGLVRSMHRSLDDLEGEVAFGRQDKGELLKFLENQKTLLASTPSIWPAKGWMSSRFGRRISPFTGEKEFHRGIDISARMNSPVIAPADGIVSAVFWDDGYGKMMTVNHGYGLVTLYGHLEKFLVKKGQYIKRGETIALLGNTGRSTGPHLHYEVHLNNVAVNPMRYILN
jgi:murein DD-endopeptidase MepM/ murein hydrolase activator NlpD